MANCNQHHLRTLSKKNDKFIKYISPWLYIVNLDSHHWFSWIAVSCELLLLLFSSKTIRLLQSFQKLECRAFRVPPGRAQSCPKNAQRLPQKRRYCSENQRSLPTLEMVEIIKKTLRIQLIIFCLRPPKRSISKPKWFVIERKSTFYPLFVFLSSSSSSSSFLFFFILMPISVEKKQLQGFQTSKHFELIISRTCIIFNKTCIVFKWFLRFLSTLEAAVFPAAFFLWPDQLLFNHSENFWPRKNLKMSRENWPRIHHLPNSGWWNSSQNNWVWLSKTFGLLGLGPKFFGHPETQDQSSSTTFAFLEESRESAKFN